MKVHIENQGEAEIRVIVDRDTVDDAQLEPGAAVPGDDLDRGRKAYM